jgi:hypothetical protein
MTEILGIVEQTWVYILDIRPRNFLLRRSDCTAGTVNCGGTELIGGQWVETYKPGTLFEKDIRLRCNSKGYNRTKGEGEENPVQRRHEFQGPFCSDQVNPLR